MRYAFLSDIHDRRHKLQAVLADAQVRGADQFISLGDVGGNDCLSLLRQAKALAVFGNYEVSRWRRLKPHNRTWVQGWPPLLARNGFLAVHAVPWWPSGLQTIEDFGTWIQEFGGAWRALFPYLTNEEPLWRAFAELEDSDAAILFHGHTHRHAIWEWIPGGRLQPLPTPAIAIKPGARYVVGVGSVGLPEDQCWASYALYDTDAGHIELVRLAQPGASNSPG